VRFILCIAGLGQETVEEVQRRSSILFTESKDFAPIVKPIGTAYRYETGMSDYFLHAIAKRFESMRPHENAAVGLLYAEHKIGTEQFLDQFFPFAATAPLAPFYWHSFDKDGRREALALFMQALAAKAKDLRSRIDNVSDFLSGTNFSPLTLPLRNFRSKVLGRTIRQLFVELSRTESLRDLLRGSCTSITESHALERDLDNLHRPYFTDDGALRFKSPGRNRHAFARLDTSHKSACLVNSRARLGAPLDAYFHYDCTHEHTKLDSTYPNCHGTQSAPGASTHVNIAPSDAIR